MSGPGSRWYCGASACCKRFSGSICRATGRVLLWILPLLLGLPANGARRLEPLDLPERDPERALVYFLRLPAVSGRLKTDFIFANDSLVGTLDNDCYTYTFLDPGKILFWRRTLGAGRIVNVEGGRVYYSILKPDRNVGPVKEARAKVPRIDEIGSLCQSTEQEQATARDDIRDKYRAAIVMGERGRPYGNPVTLLHRLEQWPRKDLSSYDALAIARPQVTDPKTKEKSWAEDASDRFPALLARTLETEAFNEVILGSAEPGSGRIAAQIEFTRYRNGLGARISFTIALTDTVTGDELIRLSGKLRGGGGEGPLRQDLERDLAFSLAIYLELSRCGPANSLGRQEAPFACKALEVRQERIQSDRPGFRNHGFGVMTRPR